MDDEEEVELVNECGDHDQDARLSVPDLTRSQAYKLYMSHAFSTWNARGYEFAAILFTAAAYPDTLVEAAIRMLIIFIAMIIFSSAIGAWVELSPNRLRTLLTTILINRGSVIIGSFWWLLILSQEDLVGDEKIFVLPTNHLLKHLLFATAVSFGIIERLSASGNLISMERDWVVTIASPPGPPHDLTNLNAVMRRIDLVCKLISPILISAIITATNSTRVGVLFTGVTSLISIPVEVFSAKRVWDSSAALRVPKAMAPEVRPAAVPPERKPLSARLRQYFHGFHQYFSTAVWVPSFALAMLHFNVMTWRATFITYLINMGYSLNVITIARTIGSVFEITSTVATPIGVQRLGNAYRHKEAQRDEEDEAEVGLIDGEETDHGERTLIGLQRFGLWGFSWQALNTAPVVLALWAISRAREEETTDPRVIPGPPILWSLILFTFLAFSRFGVWVFDLTTQQLSQTMVPQNQRSSFAGTEYSVVNVFEVLGATAAIAFPRTEQFKWLCLVSFGTVVVGWGMYAAWVRGQRGHLVHWDKLGRGGDSRPMIRYTGD